MSTPPPGAKQVPAIPLGDATANPAGMRSVKARSEKVVAVFPLETLKVNVVAPFRLRLGAANDLDKLGGITTATVAVLLAAPGPVSFELIGPVTFTTSPAAAAMLVALRLSTMEQDPLAGSVAPERLIEDDPATAVTVPVQSLVRPLGEATTRPGGAPRPVAGRESVKEIPESARLGFGLLMLKKIETDPFSATLLALNALVMVGDVATMRVADAVLPVPPLAELTGPVVLV